MGMTLGGGGGAPSLPQSGAGRGGPWSSPWLKRQSLPKLQRPLAKSRQMLPSPSPPIGDTSRGPTPLELPPDVHGTRVTRMPSSSTLWMKRQELPNLQTPRRKSTQISALSGSTTPADASPSIGSSGLSSGASLLASSGGRSSSSPWANWHSTPSSQYPRSKFWQMDDLYGISGPLRGDPMSCSGSPSPLSASPTPSGISWLKRHSMPNLQRPRRKSRQI
mmetsp:Transcript_31196/g.92862  ORF Transcript_31196/g.92862 Transcript_31196/m.92862 type:complete len:220 (+) Transcript_31196:365-1024(+)